MSRRKRRSKSTTGRFRWVSFLILSLLLALGTYEGLRIFGPNTQPFSDHRYFYIRSGSSYDQVKAALQQQGIIRDLRSFDWLARRIGYPSHVLAGRYRILRGMSNFQILQLLHSGRQTPVNLVLNKVRTKEELAALVAARLEADSTSMMTLLEDPVYLRTYGLDTNTALCAVLPDTYQFYWNSTAESVFARFVKASQRFWTPARRALADSLHLSPDQVYILASIVEEETNAAHDKPLIASVYLNRLRLGMRLSADPTVKYATGDFSLKRITDRQTSVASDFNTYLHNGLPPGPICTPSIQTLKAVLHAANTNYLYFCAKPDFSGYHAFASTFQQHLKNARRYQKFLDSLQIH